jgi:hypothetical protein
LRKHREIESAWQAACRLILSCALAEPITRQLSLALFTDARLDLGQQRRLLVFFGLWRRCGPSKDLFELRWNGHLGVCRDEPLARWLGKAGVFLSEPLIILLASRSADHILEFVLKAPDANVVLLIRQ